MKRKIALFLAVIMTVTMLFASTMPASAASVEPRWSNSDECTTSFAIDENGTALIAVTYTGREGVFTQAKLTVKIEKQFLWFFWNTVDEWTATSTEQLGYFYHEVSVDGHGTYRAVFTLEMYGTSGTTDVIEDTTEDTY